MKFDGEFDFESSNAKFKKEEVEEELQQKLNENLRITDEVTTCSFTMFLLVVCRLQVYLFVSIHFVQYSPHHQTPVATSQE